MPTEPQLADVRSNEHGKLHKVGVASNTVTIH